MRLNSPKSGIDADTTKAVPVSLTKLRHGTERHAAREPDVFPAVLDELGAVKDTENRVAIAITTDDFETASTDGEVVADDNALPVQTDFKSYLQGLLPAIQPAAIADVGHEKPEPEGGSVALSQLIAKINAGETEQVKKEALSTKADALQGSDRRLMAQPMETPDDVSRPTISILAGFDTVDSHQPVHVDSPRADIHVIKVETSFPPTASMSLVTQFSEVMSDTLEAKPVVAVHAGVVDPRPDIVRSLELQLHPDDLGKIKVAMRLRGAELNLKIEVTSRKAEELLLRDHQALKEIMGQAGYDIADAAISVTVVDTAPAQRVVSQQTQSPELFAGQNGRAFTGSQEQSRNPFHNTRGYHGAKYEQDADAKAQPDPDRDTGVYL
jgi:flagellar hook-length control protein FliK